MKKSILNLDGVQQLNRTQRQQVKGGKIDCNGSSPYVPCCCNGVGCTKALLQICMVI